MVLLAHLASRVLSEAFVEQLAGFLTEYDLLPDGLTNRYDATTTEARIAVEARRTAPRAEYSHSGADPVRALRHLRARQDRLPRAVL